MNKLITIASLLLIASLASCRKIIDIDVRASEVKYVIEGNVTDQSLPASVKISRSVPLNATNSFPAVSNASVYIKDLTENAGYMLVEQEPGIYQSAQLKGIPGHQYQLVVTIEGTEYNALSTMPFPVALDTLYMARSILGTELRGEYIDPAAYRNYYRFVALKNGTPQDGIVLADDELNNGKRAIQSVLTREDTAFRAGDHIVATLECVDQGIYQYYANLAMSADPNFSSPGNPKSNISGNALGYFSAHTSSSRSIHLPD